MKLAIISPIDMLELSNIVDDYHMILPQLVLENDHYMAFYHDLRGYKILDNGEAEGIPVEPAVLAGIADQVLADEIVVPDAMGDMPQTIDLLRKFERYVRDDYNYMGVVQGQTIKEMYDCLQAFKACEWVTCVGLPRHMNEVMGKMTRLTLAEKLVQEWAPDMFNFPVHALGGSPWITEVRALRDVGIRGMDTSLPVVLGLEGRLLDGPYCERRPDFFEQQVDRNSRVWRICGTNVRRYLGWAGYSAAEAPGSPL